MLEQSHSKLEPCRLAPTRDVVRVATPGRAAADRTGLPGHRCDRRSQGFRTDVRTQSVLATRRMLMGPAKPSCAGHPTATPPYERRAAPGRRLAATPPPCPCLDPWLACVLVVNPSPRHKRL
jgi:hypothetical protein